MWNICNAINCYYHFALPPLTSHSFCRDMTLMAFGIHKLVPMLPYVQIARLVVLILLVLTVLSRHGLLLVFLLINLSLVFLSMVVLVKLRAKLMVFMLNWIHLMAKSVVINMIARKKIHALMLRLLILANMNGVLLQRKALHAMNLAGPLFGILSVKHQSLSRDPSFWLLMMPILFTQRYNMPRSKSFPALCFGLWKWYVSFITSLAQYVSICSFINVTRMTHIIPCSMLSRVSDPRSIRCFYPSFN